MENRSQSNYSSGYEVGGKVEIISTFRSVWGGSVSEGIPIKLIEPRMRPN
jgi:hypothetical protein